MRAFLCWLMAVSLLLPARPSNACPLYESSPPPLLTAQLAAASAIVVVRLEGVSTEPLFFEGGDQALHQWMQHYRVLRTLKGSVPRSFRAIDGELSGEEVPFTAVRDGRPRLLFVKGADESGSAAAPVLDVEEMSLDDAEDVAVFANLIDEAQQLSEKGASKEAQREWLVRCAMRRATRGHAVEVLLSESGRIPKADELPLAQELTWAQRRAILDGFRQEPTTDGTFVGVLALTRGVPHPAFDRVAVGVMETLLSGPEGAMSAEAPHALYLLMERLGVADFEARWRAARQVPEAQRASEDAGGFGDAAHRQMRVLWESLRAEGYLLPAPYVPYALSAVDRRWLSAD